MLSTRRFGTHREKNCYSVLFVAFCVHQGGKDDLFMDVENCSLVDIFPFTDQLVTRTFALGHYIGALMSFEAATPDHSQGFKFNKKIILSNLYTRFDCHS